MKRIIFGSTALWSTILLIALIFGVFIMPVMPDVWQPAILRTVYTIIYFSAILSLEKKNNFLLVLFFSTLITEWVSSILSLPVLLLLAKGVNIIFFLVIVVLLIRQIAMARKVSPGVILDSVAGYLLLGMIFSIFILFILQNDPGAFYYSQNQTVQSGGNPGTSLPIYFSVVTLATLGYGDIVPVESYTRSLSIFIAITGQFYIAIIVALLVGKFSAQRNSPLDE